MSQLIQSKVTVPFTALCFGYLSITLYKPTENTQYLGLIQQLSGQKAFEASKENVSNSTTSYTLK